MLSSAQCLPACSAPQSLKAVWSHIFELNQCLTFVSHLWIVLKPHTCFTSLLSHLWIESKPHTCFTSLLSHLWIVLKPHTCFRFTSWAICWDRQAPRLLYKVLVCLHICLVLLTAWNIYRKLAEKLGCKEGASSDEMLHFLQVIPRRGSLAMQLKRWFLQNLI